MTTPPLPSRPPSAAAAGTAHTAVVSPDLVPDRRGVTGVLSHVKRDGEWLLPRLFRAFAFMGNVELDLTRVRIGPGTTRMELVCIFGSITVVVPPEIRVETFGDPFIGSYEIQRSAESTAAPDAPLIEIHGSVYMGSIEIKIVDPNAPGWFDRLRARWTGQG